MLNPSLQLSGKWLGNFERNSKPTGISKLIKNGDESLGTMNISIQYYLAGSYRNRREYPSGSHAITRCLLDNSRKRSLQNVGKKKYA